MEPEHYSIQPPPDWWPEADLARWWADFRFMAGACWDELPMQWYLDQLGDS